MLVPILLCSKRTNVDHLPPSTPVSLYYIGLSMQRTCPKWISGGSRVQLLWEIQRRVWSCPQQVSISHRFVYHKLGLLKRFHTWVLRFLQSHTPMNTLLFHVQSRQLIVLTVCFIALLLPLRPPISVLSFRSVCIQERFFPFEASGKSHSKIVR